MAYIHPPRPAKTHVRPRQGLARAIGGAYLDAMARRAAYIILLLTILVISLAAIALALDGLAHPPFLPHALLAGAYFGALSALSLAEEAAEWLFKNKTARLPCRWEGWV
jgi:hypothetical protein